MLSIYLEAAHWAPQDFTYEANSSILTVEEPSPLGNTLIFPEYLLVPASTPVAPAAPVYCDAERAWAGVNEFRIAIHEGKPIDVALLRSQQAVGGYISGVCHPELLHHNERLNTLTTSLHVAILGTYG